MQEEVTIFRFGMEQLIRNGISYLSILVIGILFHELLPCLIFMCSFRLLRTRAGGYHASSPARCYVLTMTIVVAMLLAYKYVHLDSLIYMGLFFLFSLVIALLAPVDTLSNPFDEIEKKYYRKKIYILWSFELVVAIVFLIVHKEQWLWCMVLALMVLSVSLAAEVVHKNKCAKEHN